MIRPPDWSDRLMTPGDIAAWQAACFPQINVICRDIVRRVEQGELHTALQIDRAMTEAIDRSPLVQRAWLAEVHRAMPSVFARALPTAFALDDAALDRLVVMMRARGVPDAVRQGLEDAMPTRYRSPTPLLVRVRRGDIPLSPSVNSSAHDVLDRLIAGWTPTNIDDGPEEWLALFIEVDYEDYVSHLTDHLAQRANHGELATSALIDRAIEDAVARSPLAQPDWVNAYVEQLPSHPPPLDGAAIARWTDSVRQSISIDVRVRIAAVLPALAQAPKQRPAP